jgi:hypothetical protein
VAKQWLYGHFSQAAQWFHFFLLFVVLLFQVVMRRFKAFEAVRRLQSLIGPMLDGTSQPLLMKTQELSLKIITATLAVGDLATLVLLPAEQRVIGAAGSSPLAAAGAAAAGAGRGGQGLQLADACVLQLLLTGRVLELAGAALSLYGQHLNRLVQQQLQQQPPPSEQGGKGWRGGDCVAILKVFW